MTEAADRADRYWLASGGLLARIQATPDDRWDAASPCAEWTDMHAMLSDPARSATRLPGGPLGPVPAGQAADVIGIMELLVHTWDLARATGGDERLAPDLVARTHQALLPHYENLQATGAFAPSIPAPGDADPQSAFLYFTGRRP